MSTMGTLHSTSSTLHINGTAYDGEVTMHTVDDPQSLPDRRLIVRRDLCPDGLAPGMRCSIGLTALSAPGSYFVTAISPTHVSFVETHLPE